MKTCFTVQSTDGSSFLPKESTLQIGKASRLLEMGGWGPRASSKNAHLTVHAARSTWGDKAGLGGQ